MPLADASQVGDARRRLGDLLGGWSETERGKAAIITTELATNVLRHGGGGELLASTVHNGEGVLVLEVLALDRGPGMANAAACLRDGYSTAGSAGTGLGAVMRLASGFDLYSRAGGGAAVLARLDGARGTRPPAVAVGGVAIAKSGEKVCGDAWALKTGPGWSSLLVVDGLGHGPGAAEPAQTGVAGFLEDGRQAPAAVLDRMHRALRKTRGAAAAVSELDLARGRLCFAGIGNVAGGMVVAGLVHRLLSDGGILGHQARVPREQALPWHPGGLLVMHTDGLRSQWSLEGYPGLAGRDPSLVAGVLYRDFTRGTDDVTVVVATA